MRVYQKLKVVFSNIFIEKYQQLILINICISKNDSVDVYEQSPVYYISLFLHLDNKVERF